MSRVLEPVNRATAIMVAHTTHEQYDPARRGVVQRAKNLVHAQRLVAYIDKTDSRMGHAWEDQPVPCETPMQRPGTQEG